MCRSHSSKINTRIGPFLIGQSHSEMSQSNLDTEQKSPQAPPRSQAILILPAQHPAPWLNFPVSLHPWYLHHYYQVCTTKWFLSHSVLPRTAPRKGEAWGGKELPRSFGIFSNRLGSFSLKLLCFLFSPFVPHLSMVWCPQRVQEQTPAGHIPHCLCCSLQLSYMDPLIACMSFRLFSMHELSAKPCWKCWNFTFFMEIFHIKWAVLHFPWNSWWLQKIQPRCSERLAQLAFRPH